MNDQASLDRSLKKRIQSLARPLEPLVPSLSPKLESLSCVEAVLFDVYGTMLISDTSKDSNQSQSDRGNKALLETLEAVHLSMDPGIQNENLFSRYTECIRLRRQEMKKEGNPSPEVHILNIWRRFLEQMQAENLIHGRPSENDELLQIMGVEFELRFNPCWPMPFLAETLQKLRADSFVLGIISNSQFYTPLALEALLNQTLEQVGFNPSLLYWSYKHGIAKPAIGFYEPAAQTLMNSFDIPPEKTLYIGNDMLNDVYPASEIGFKTALFGGDKRSLKLRKGDKRIKNLTPDLILTSFSQLLECIR